MGEFLSTIWQFLITNIPLNVILFVVLFGAGIYIWYLIHSKKILEARLKTNNDSQRIADFDTTKRKKNQNSPKEILIVDDDDNFRQLTLVQIKKYIPNTSMSLLQHGRNAINRIKVHKPDLLILDVRLPDMTGFEVVKGLASICCDLPFFLVSGLVSLEEMNRSFPDNLSKVILFAKPLNEITFYSAVKAMLVD